MRFSFTAFRKVLLRIRRDILYVNEPTSRNRNGKSERRESIDASETLLVSSLVEKKFQRQTKRGCWASLHLMAVREATTTTTIKEKENNDRLFLRLKCFDCNFPKERREKDK